MIFEAKSHIVELSEVIPLRQKILKPFATVDECINEGDQDQNAIHVGTYVGPRLVAIATFLREGHSDFDYGQSYRLRGMATEPSFRNQGYGTHVLSWGMERLRKIGVDFLWCNARVKAFSFYEKMGFFYHGDLFEIPKIGPHKVMYRRLLK